MVKKKLATVALTSAFSGVALLGSAIAAEAARFSANDTAVFNVSVLFSGNSIDFVDVNGSGAADPNNVGIGEYLAGGRSGGFLSSPAGVADAAFKDLCRVQIATSEGCLGDALATNSTITEDTLVDGKVIDFIKVDGDFAIDLRQASFEFDVVPAPNGAPFRNVVSTFDGVLRDLQGGGGFTNIVGSFVQTVPNFSFVNAGFDLDNAENFVFTGGNIATFTVQAVPEPSTIIGSIFFSLAGIGLALRKKRSKTQQVVDV